MESGHIPPGHRETAVRGELLLLLKNHLAFVNRNHVQLSSYYLTASDDDDDDEYISSSLRSSRHRSRLSFVRQGVNLITRLVVGTNSVAPSEKLDHHHLPF